MLNSINDVSISLGLSKMTVYRKLKVKELKSHIIVKQGIQYLDDKGLTLLTKMLNPSCNNVNADVKPNVTDDTPNIEVAIDSECYISSLKSEIKFLKSEMQEKNLQINNLNNRLSCEQELHKNTQVLQLKQQKPQQDIKLLEEHFQDLDTKLMDIKEHIQEKKDQKHRGIFKKIFEK